uniref:Uncharacterized protein n=1 Tax=Magnetospirillum gryphiswaldense TaxID=55518 RepID=A4U0V2_9PROT|nr:hypothetical protein MGR_0332 [Magnetospirillum gryphiswaldense MSR-1]
MSSVPDGLHGHGTETHQGSPPMARSIWLGDLGTPTREAPYGLGNGVPRHRGEIHHLPDWDMRAARSLWVLIILVRCPLICSRFFANAACCFKRFA